MRGRKNETEGGDERAHLRDEVLYGGGEVATLSNISCIYMHGIEQYDWEM
jgi:hypothetical protein